MIQVSPIFAWKLNQINKTKLTITLIQEMDYQKSLSILIMSSPPQTTDHSNEDQFAEYEL